ncbi:hypothetical protein SKAU_G00276180 [Synaphobranchus kaupii]|uniref:Uncharacterized protein n=1 Tax=Synaphobranchus kaupii TaxID=118154 RepID=A0A9Q1F161_SYNKA|nr:hypothetical protein SKAU_G00276180 [Synaphobranchus kaupii]
MLATNAFACPHRQRAGESAGSPPLSTAPGEGTSAQGEQGKNMQENVRVSSAVDETVSRSITPEQPVGEALSEPGAETSKQASGAEVINETGVEIASEVGGGEPSQTEQTPGSAENSTPVPEPEASGENSELGEARQTAQRAGPSQENVIEPQTQQAESVKEAAILGTATASGETSLKGGSEDTSAETLESVELGQNAQSSGEGAVEAPAIGSQGNSEIEDMDQDYESDTQSVSDVLSQGGDVYTLEEIN